MDYSELRASIDIFCIYIILATHKSDFFNSGCHSKELMFVSPKPQSSRNLRAQLEDSKEIHGHVAAKHPMNGCQHRKS